ncbi:MAG: beta-lactamase family protein [Bacteroidetes bacterium]|nr:beta-lactamase family protein [Bacteroidota bacterium]
MKKLIKFLLIFFALVVAVAYATDYDYLLKAVRTIYFKGHKTAYLDDYKVFENRVIAKSSDPQPWNLHQAYNTVSVSDTMEAYHKKMGTVAFMVIKNDSIWYEKYYEDYHKASLSNSFSMAKSIVVSLMGKAIMEGKIKSLDQLVSYYFPQFGKGLAKELTVGDLASMASGLEWDESYYSPFSITTRAYFYDDLENMMLTLNVVDQPGEAYKYLSGNTQLLGMIVEKATGKTMSEYLSENFWQPMGAENDALWQVDKPEGIEKAYCCIASNARDFSRFGKLYMQNGRWKNQQILDSAMVAMFTRPRFEASPQYGYGWWLSSYKNKRIFLMNGHLGQYVICIPEDNLIITRLGHLKDIREEGDSFNKDFYAYIDEAYRMLNMN